MAKLDFRSMKQPTLDLYMADEAETVLHVKIPTVEMLERLKANVGDLAPIITGGDTADLSAIFDMAAEFIKHNREHIDVTGEDLRTKYNFDLPELVAFFKAYLEFVTEIQNAKN